MSGDHGHDHPFDPEVGFHASCVTDLDRPVFDNEWQRRAFGLAVALSEFGHYPWDAFQQQLIQSIGTWEQAPADARGRWGYYEHWVTALTAQVTASGLLDGALAATEPLGHQAPPTADHPRSNRPTDHQGHAPARNAA